jgi:cell division protein DivIC
MDNQMDNETRNENMTQPSVEELNRTRTARVAERKKARKKKKREVKRAKRKAAMASGKKRRRKVNKMALALGLVLLVVFGASIRNILSLRAENKKLEKQHKKLTEQRSELKEELKNVNSREYIEKRAREQLRLVNPDEIIFVFPDEE